MNKDTDKSTKRDCSDQSHAKKKYVRPKLLKKQKLALITGMASES